MFEDVLRRCLSRWVTGGPQIALRNHVPSVGDLKRRFQDIDALGIYLHIPFCKQVCPYCPYNREIYAEAAARDYVDAVKKEIDLYTDILGNRPVTSFYIGGGTPTTLLNSGIEEILRHIRERLNIQCDFHMESHPNDLSENNLRAIRSMEVAHLSIGVEALQEHHLQRLHRPYTVDGVKAAVGRAVDAGFTCVNVDVMFALPGQTCGEIEETGQALVEMGVDQVAAYPLFRFPYTRMGRAGNGGIGRISSLFRRRRMLRIFEKIFYGAGFRRTSVWAFTRTHVPRYCSVTVPLYVGLGASGGSYLRDLFYVNTFGVHEYIRAMEEKGTAIALSLQLSPRMQMAGWLYWRVYETAFEKAVFAGRFGKGFDEVFGKYTKPLELLGFLRDEGERIALSDAGTYWLHAFEDFFSIAYISRLWGTSRHSSWPEEVAL